MSVYFFELTENRILRPLSWPTQWEGKTIYVCLSCSLPKVEGGADSAVANVGPRVRVIINQRVELLTQEEIENRRDEFLKAPIFFDAYLEKVYLDGKLVPELRGISYQVLYHILRNQCHIPRERLRIEAWPVNGQACAIACDKAISRLKGLLRKHLTQVTLKCRSGVVRLEEPDDFVLICEK